MSTGNPKFAGLTDDQVKMVLEQIATTLNTARSICLSEAIESDNYVFDLLAHMLAGAGALADAASGEGVVGDLNAWLCGPLFHREARAARVPTPPQDHVSGGGRPIPLHPA